MQDAAPPTKRLSVKALRQALLSIREWRTRNDSQSTMHLIHLLAVKWKGAKPEVPIEYTEQAVDFEFCDRFMRINSSENPYYDPLGESYRISTHPHSNVATARKKTFTDKWKAGEFETKHDKEYFTLKNNYEQILISNMAKGGSYKKLDPLALAFFLYRDTEFPLDYDISQLTDKLKVDFNFNDAEWAAIFERHSLTKLHEGATWEAGANELQHKLLIQALVSNIDEFDFLTTLGIINRHAFIPVIKPAEICSLIQNQGYRQIILQGPPGTGKTHLAMEVTKCLLQARFSPTPASLSNDITTCEASWSIIQFHPTYDYDTFIQRQLPVKDPSGSISFAPEDMAFLNACTIARAQAPEIFVLIIDEINRADLGKVFGELLYAIEYRESQLSLQYDSRKSFSVPKNLLVIGTMNTADSSVAHIDYAIRRRFIFIDIEPDPSVLNTVIENQFTKNAALELFRSTNVLFESNPRFQVGQTFFIHQSVEALAFAFVYQVLPLLKAYQDNGLLPADAVILPSEWDSEPIAVRSHLPQDLAREICEWASKR